MVRPLRKREHDTIRDENPGLGHALRLSIALERENQPDVEARERVIRMRIREAKHWGGTF